MKKIAIFFGSTMGTCEDIANRIAGNLDSPKIESVENFTADDAENDILVLGTSTWADGEVQDYWYDGLETLKSMDLSGKTVVIFGCGDSMGYPETFCNGMKDIYDAAIEAGATIKGQISTEGYEFESSSAVVDDQFVGVAFDEMNEPEKSDDRIAHIVETIKSI